MVVAEALAHGVPVIASKGTPWSGVEAHGCGLWVENDPATLAAAIERMSQHAARRDGRTRPPLDGGGIRLGNSRAGDAATLW